ncbi:hypothetical protein Lalb_Chr20g0120641 [Lupinus albus]|uniref:Uncharacterized protein n=1 Tax=Lupinus albus TaxID=3870 RepID=A0A6A4NZ10_LUPAL|nr:hypothetical protein Lalb_Chr20g0120641 [Lupinus albus]
MKPKDCFVKGPCRVFFLMHVTRSSNMVNPLIIECCKQKETITSGSEIGADNSSFGMVAGSF